MDRSETCPILFNGNVVKIVSLIFYLVYKYLVLQIIDNIQKLKIKINQNANKWIKENNSLCDQHKKTKNELNKSKNK